MKIAVAIPTYNRDAVLLNTIRDVLAQAPPADEVLVIDQSPSHSADVAADLAALDESGKIRLINLPVPNLPAARNVALREATSEIVLFIDDDVRLSAGFVQAHKEQYLDAAITAVTGRIVDCATESIPSRAAVAAASARTVDRFWRRLRPRQPPGYTHPGELDYLYLNQEGDTDIESVANLGGGNHSIRRVVAMESGGYDERFIGRAVAEDSDMALRLWKAGRRIKFSARAHLEHLWVSTGGCRDRGGRSAKWFYEECFANLLFLFKHFYPRRPFWSDVLRLHPRRYFITRAALGRPWHLPAAFLGYVIAFCRAAREARKYRKSALAKDAKT